MKKEGNHSERAHSMLGASSAKRWLNCPGSINLIKKCPPQAQSPHAIEGTKAHELAERMLKSGVCNTYTIGYDDEMVKHVLFYVNYVRELQEKIKGELLVEHRFHLKHLHPDFFGTCDTVLMQHFGDLHVLDFKYGQGVEVEVEHNEQGMYYALAALGLGDFENIYIHIVQPRVENPIKVWKTSPGELLEFGKRLRVGAAATTKKDATLKVGEWCGFCPANGACPEKFRQASEIAKTKFDDLKPEFPIPELMTKEQIAKVIEYSKPIIKWFNEVENFALNMFMNGEKIEGLKLVRGRARREWIDEDRAGEILSNIIAEKAFVRKLLSVAQAEKLVHKSHIEGLYQTIDGSPDVAPLSDKRKAIQSAKDAFEEIEGF